MQVVKWDQGGRRGFVAVGGMICSAVSPWIFVFVLKKKCVSQAGFAFLITLPQSCQQILMIVASSLKPVFLILGACILWSLEIPLIRAHPAGHSRKHIARSPTYLVPLLLSALLACLYSL